MGHFRDDEYKVPGMEPLVQMAQKMAIDEVLPAPQDKLCKKHSRYQGKRPPTTKLTEADGCTCHAAYQKIVDARTTAVIVERHSDLFGYSGEASKTWNDRIESKDWKEIAKKIFKKERPGLGQLLKIYEVTPEGRKYLCSVGAQVSANIQIRGDGTHTHLKALATCFVRRDEKLSPTDIHKV